MYTLLVVMYEGQKILVNFQTGIFFMKEEIFFYGLLGHVNCPLIVVAERCNLYNGTAEKRKLKQNDVLQEKLCKPTVFQINANYSLVMISDLYYVFSVLRIFFTVLLKYLEFKEINIQRDMCVSTFTKGLQKVLHRKNLRKPWKYS